MTAIVHVGAKSYDVDTKDGNKEFIKAIKDYSRTIPAGKIDLLFLKVNGKGVKKGE